MTLPLAALGALLPLLAYPPQAGSPPPRIDPPIAIVHVSIVDVRAREVRLDRTVLVSDRRIVTVGAADEITIPADAVTIECRGRFLIPGLWDMHVHLTDATGVSLPALIASGVTGVRDAGGDLDAIDAWRAEIRAGERVGPRIVRPGPYLDGYKPDAPFRLTLGDSGDAVAAVAYVAARGADYVKIHNGVPRESYFALAAESERLGIPFAGHVPLEVSPSEAALAGQASMEHAVTFFEGTFRALAPADPQSQIAAIAAFVASGADTLAARLRLSGVHVTPTLLPSVLRGRRVALADDPPDCLETVARSLRDQWDRFFPVGERDRAPGVEEARALFARHLVSFTEILHAAGVPILAGSDLGARDVCPGISLHEELELLVDAGLPAIDALRSATIVPATYLGMQDSVGGVEAGKLADLVLLDADPVTDIRNTRRIVAVISDGRLYDRSALDSLLVDVVARAPEE